ncbi:COG2378 Predicted transcriptional regulator [Methylophilaceae bacterium]
MSNNERIYRIDQLLNDKKVVSFQELLNRLEISPATLKRDLAYMRDRLNAPLVYDKELNGYRFEANTESYSLPGLWFTPEEIYALLAMDHLLGNLDASGLLGKQIKPLQSRLLAMLDSTDNSLEEIRKRVKIEKIGARKLDYDFFQEIGMSLVKRKRLSIEYQSRSKDEYTIREISPQRIIYYRDNWYLDAWCHERNALRSFSLDAIKKLELIDRRALDIEEDELDSELGSGYGIFAGKDVQWATLLFNSDRARWVANETWHPNQEGNYLPDGSYELRVPFSDTREILMDIMRYGSDVKIISPELLVKALLNNLEKLSEQYAQLR